MITCYFDFQAAGAPTPPDVTFDLPDEDEPDVTFDLPDEDKLVEPANLDMMMAIPIFNDIGEVCIANLYQGDM